METFSALLAICAGNSPVSGEFPAQRPVTRSFGVFFDLRLNERLNKRSWGWWLETPTRPLWRHGDETDQYETITKPNKTYTVCTILVMYAISRHVVITSFISKFDPLLYCIRFRSPSLNVNYQVMSTQGRLMFTSPGGTWKLLQILERTTQCVPVSLWYRFCIKQTPQWQKAVKSISVREFLH